MTIDCGRFAANLDDALMQARDTDFLARRVDAAARGRLRGLGVGCFSKRRAARRTKPPKYASIRMAGFR